MNRKNKFDIRDLLISSPNSQLLFVGALNCIRHRGTQMVQLMKEGRLAFLCPSSSDFSTGRYLKQIVDAIVELSEERNTKDFTLMYGCQLALLSTDFDFIVSELKDNYSINVVIHNHCRLCDSKDRREI
ncbi:MAG: hypothetical protein ACI4XM_07500 [Candidatus Coprovivens sp.]